MIFKIKNKKVLHQKHIIISFIISVLIIIALAYNPLYICNNQYKSLIPSKIEDDIKDLGKGFYSPIAPLFPVYIKVLFASPEIVRVNIKYLYWGNIEYTIDNEGTKNIIKPLY